MFRIFSGPPHHTRRHFVPHIPLVHTIALLALLFCSGFFSRPRLVDAHSARINASAVFMRAPSYRLRIFSRSAKGKNYLDLNITERGRQELLSGEMVCNQRPLRDFYDDVTSDDTVEYCEIVFH